MDRLREGLAYRWLGFGAQEVADLVDDPNTDEVAHLHRLPGRFVSWSTIPVGALAAGAPASTLGPRTALLLPETVDDWADA